MAAAPNELTLKFSEPVRLTALKVTRAGETPRELGPLPAERQKDFNVASPGLSKGQYMVSWRAFSGDAHVMTGEFTFAISEPLAGGSSRGASHAEHDAQHEKH